MKIADSDNIKAGEQELISSIIEKLDPSTLAQVATKQLSPENMEFLNGDLVIQDDRIVYKVDFRATVEISVMFDRNGDLVSTNDDQLPVDLPGLDDEEGSPDAFLDDDMDEIYDDEGDTEEGEPSGETEPQSLDDELAQVFSRTRDFWEQKREAAQDETDLPEASGDA